MQATAFDTEADALHALSDALLAWAKGATP
mgnify:CR=1 FL=1